MSQLPRNHYKLLQVDEQAETEIIGAVYRRLALRYHPDRDPSPEAAVRMAAINEAWNTLRDAEKRRAYDASLAAQRGRRSTDRFAARSAPVQYGEAGVPTGAPSGSRLDFGRYRGWTIGQIARHDPVFLEWLAGVPGGRQYRDEINRVLAGRTAGLEQRRRERERER